MTSRPAGAARSLTVSFSAIRPLLPWVLAAWFVAISAMRLAFIARDGPGFDGRLYRSATLAWLHGQDPWTVVQGGVYFAAPPPSLLPMIPFALLPEPVAIAALVGAGVLGTAWALRRLKAPLWWLAFPPLVDAIWNGNPHVLVVPLVLAGAGPLAVFVKVYAAVPLVLLRRVRALVVTALALTVTAPFLPWRQFVDDLPTILMQLRLQSDGGLSVFALPAIALVVAAVVAVIALAVIGRERAAWLAVPVLWPSTQWYYASIAIPAVVRPAAPFVAAAILAIPLVQGPLLAVVVFAGLEVATRLRERRAHGTLPSPIP